MVKQTKAKTFQAYLDSCHRRYSCVHCRAHLANHDELISKVTFFVNIFLSKLFFCLILCAKSYCKIVLIIVICLSVISRKPGTGVSVQLCVSNKVFFLLIHFGWYVGMYYMNALQA